MVLSYTYPHPRRGAPINLPPYRQNTTLQMEAPMPVRLTFLLVLLGFACGSASGQLAVTDGVSYSAPAVTGAAYSAEEFAETVLTLADGTQITQQTARRKVWRDAQGRTRTENWLSLNGDTAAQIIAEIVDPVAGYRYTLETANKIAHRAILPPTAPRAYPEALQGAVLTAVVSLNGIGLDRGLGNPATAPKRSTELPRPQVSNESLGSRTIAGVPAEGMRTITVFPGAEQPSTVVSETWTSPALHLTLLSKSTHPVSGVNTFQLRNLSTTAPDAALFQVPADFRVEDW